MEIILFTVTSFLVGLSGAVVPGPMLTVTISESAEKGFKAGPLVVSGHIITEIALITIILAGLGWIIGSKTASIVIETVGGVALVYMGYSISRSKNHLPDVSVNDEDQISPRYGPVLGGVITSISNPYFFIWWATIGGVFMLNGLELSGVLGFLGFLVGHWSADLGWYSAVSFFTSKGSKLMDERSYRMVMKICGGFLIILGVYFIISVLFNHNFL